MLFRGVRTRFEEFEDAVVREGSVLWRREEEECVCDEELADWDRVKNRVVFPE